MSRRLSFGELTLVTSVLAIGGFVGVQAVASSPHRPAPAAPEPALSADDSAAIARDYRERVPRLRLGTNIPDWLAQVHIDLLRRSALRAATAPPPAPVPPDTVRAVLAAGWTDSYLGAMLSEDSARVMRWRARAEPILVWVQPSSSARGFSRELVDPTRASFRAWNDLGLGVRFEFTDDSTRAEVHVTWSAVLPSMRQIGNTFRMSDGDGWITFAHVVLNTSYDIFAVQNAARHEVGHVLGLGHSPDPIDIMAAATEGKQVHLTAADRKTAALFYRLPAGKVR